MAAMITWLRYHNSSSSQVQEMMEKTCKFRASKIREKDKTVLQLLDEYPRLIDTDGMTIAYANKQVNWKQLLHFDGILETDDQESNVALQILPLLFPPRKKKTNSKDGKKGPNKHASVVEAWVSLTIFKYKELQLLTIKNVFSIQIGTNLPSFLENTTKKQPFILGLGERENPEQTFVIERKALPCGKKILKAVDVCFKLFYLLDTDYPWESQNTWDFIQIFIFGLGEGKGKQKSVPSVTLLQNFLNKK
ncbi:hypothetical protein HOLleu_44995 [Holothuria leucospilota]|uniref:Uncharacterized protein n=1 Tax=Holothuria leucospilota TaxID=206669 RepID=A0A9Q0YCP7_HOLLE|nr:hypothetical protein HOLleu_44995 [Holothuria leucospilota]